MDEILNQPIILAVFSIFLLLMGFGLGRSADGKARSTLAADLASSLSRLRHAETEAVRLSEQTAHHVALLTASNEDRAALRNHVAELQVRTAQADADIAGLRCELAAATDKHEETVDRHASEVGGLRIVASRAETELAEMQRKACLLEVQLAETRMNLANERDAAREKIELLSAVRADMETRFRQIATESLRQNGDEMQKTGKERLEAALGPLKQHVDHFQLELKQVHEGALRDRAALKVEIETLTRRSEEVSREALALTRALKGDKQKQGAWGEMILANLLEKSGLRKGEEYFAQEHRVSAEGGRYRPDVVIKMPGGKTLVIDSKVSLVDYEICVNADCEEALRNARLRHVAALRRHIDLLSAKAYHELEIASLDVVVMFIPIEGALSEALRENGELTSYALEKNVTIATPTTLIMALRTISSVWSIERRNQNAEEIARRAGLLYDKVASFSESMQAVGKHLTGAEASYEEAMNRLTRGGGNVLGQVHKLKALGAKTTKSVRIEFDESDEGDPDLSNVVSLSVSDQTAG